MRDEEIESVKKETSFKNEEKESEGGEPIV